MQRAFVLDKNKNPLMPCHPARARKLLKQGKAAAYRLYSNDFKLQFCRAEIAPSASFQFLDNRKGLPAELRLASDAISALQNCNLKSVEYIDKLSYEMFLVRNG